MPIELKLKFREWLSKLSQEDFDYTRGFIRQMLKHPSLSPTARLVAEDKLELVVAEEQHRALA